MILKSQRIDLSELAGEVKRLSDDGFRFVTMTCVKEEDGFKVIYTFEKDYEMENMHIIVKDGKVPSIAGIYFCAVLAENEIQDLFGIKFSGLPLDFQGGMLLSGEGPITPMASVEVIRKKGEGEK